VPGEIEQLFGSPVVPARPLKIAFFGLPLAALLLLEDDYELGLAVISPVAAPGGRRLRRRVGEAKVVPAPQSDGQSAALSARLQALAPDLIVSWFYTRLIEPGWLAIPRLGALGAHPSLLPRHRGPNPFFWCIDQGDTQTGVSIHRLTPEYDRGPVLTQRPLPVGERDAWQLARALDRVSLRLLRDTLASLQRGETVRETVQDEARASWAAEPTAELLRVDWGWPSERVLRRIRALSPVPGLAVEVRGLRFFITAARPTQAVPTALLPGEAALLRTAGSHELVIATGDGALVIERAVLADDDVSVTSCPYDRDGIAHALLRHAPEMVGSVIPVEGG
jgi:methionyl-tRNA formyltransferase